MRKHTHVGIEEPDFPNEEYSFLKHPKIADLFKNQFPNESDILINGWDDSEWCDWSNAYTMWVGFLSGVGAAKKEDMTSNTIIITLKSLITPEAHEKLEDSLSEFLHEQGFFGSIDNTATGNTTVIKRRR